MRGTHSKKGYQFKTEYTTEITQYTRCQVLLCYSKILYFQSDQSSHLVILRLGDFDTRASHYNIFSSLNWSQEILIQLL